MSILQRDKNGRALILPKTNEIHCLLFSYAAMATFVEFQNSKLESRVINMTLNVEADSYIQLKLGILQVVFNWCLYIVA